MDEDVENQTKEKNLDLNYVEADHLYCELPLDIWFMISEHIFPEDVGRFALICKATHYVASTAKFCHRLYYRFYKPYMKLPPQFQPDSIRRLEDLRLAVIRSFFYIYPPMIERQTFSTDTSVLINLQIIGKWFTKDHNWTMCFKFREKRGKKKTCKRRSNEISSLNDDTTDLDEPTCYVNENPEEGCKMLIISTSSFIPIPTFLSRKLFVSAAKARPKDRHYWRYIRLHLKFVDNSGKFVGKVNFNKINIYEIHDWWSRKYNVRGSDGLHDWPHCS